MSDEEIAAFAQGRLGADERSRIEQHVDLCEACARLMHQAIRALNSTMVSNLAELGTDWAATFAPGILVAERYEIRRFIARGGMGEVYEAFDRQLQERVALKTVTASASDSPRAIRDFKAEVQLARRVTHANVCRIYDLGTHALKHSGVVHFLTMEFVEGETLGQILRTQGALPLAQCERFARALLQALAAAHSAGILHRDFKSDNVMVRRDGDGQLTPIILDFGLARHLDERSRARSSGHAMVGTLTYMAPEQVEGTPLSRATDIYAFGVVWFEMLTGKIPFAGPPQLSALERLTKAPSAPSQFNRQVPRVVDVAVLRCLARHPSQRFQSAQEVLSSLDAAAGPQVVAPRPYSTPMVGAATLLVGTVLYLLVRGQALSPTVAVASAVTATTATTASGPEDSASVPLHADTTSNPPFGGAGFSSPPAAKNQKAPAQPKPAPQASAPQASAPQASAPPKASASAQSEPGRSSSAKRSWTFGRIPLPVASPSASASVQNLTP